MTGPQHSADDGSFTRSAGNAAFRGTMLILGAVLIGVLLLRATDDSVTVASSRPDNPQAQNDDDDKGATTTTALDEAPPVTARPPAQVKVLVANGSDVSGAASKVSDRLAVDGYNVLAATNTDDEVQRPSVYWAAGYEAEAAAVAEALGIGPGRVSQLPDVAPVDDVRGANVLVIIDRAIARQAVAGG